MVNTHCSTSDAANSVDEVVGILASFCLSLQGLLHRLERFVVEPMHFLCVKIAQGPITDDDSSIEPEKESELSLSHVA